MIRRELLMLSTLPATEWLKINPRVASPNPRYKYKWIRDEAICMRTILTGVRRGVIDRKMGTSVLRDYLVTTKSDQMYDLGEPKFELDGTPFRGPWARPQNDGPALRALSQMHISMYTGDFVETWHSNITTDLDYVAEHCMDESYDLWEERKGVHPFNLMVYAKALRSGKILAPTMEQREKYQKAYDDIVHYRPATVRLDSSLIMGCLYGDRLFFTQDEILDIKETLKKTFKEEYSINKNADAVLYGRYPNDTYDGYATDGLGNPWILVTCCIAEYLAKVGDVKEAKAMLDRVKSFGPWYSEQIHRDTGLMTGVEDLSWSYASLVSAEDYMTSVL